MKAVLQRVKYSNVKIDGNIVGSCGNGFMILLGVMQGDTLHDAVSYTHLRAHET